MTKRRTYRFRILASAARELEHEIEYSENRWGKRHALAYRRSLLATIERIVLNPHAYRLRPEIGDDYRLVRHKGNYIVYRIDEETREVEIWGFPSIYRSLSE